MELLAPLNFEADPYDEEFHSESGKGEAKTYARSIAAKLTAGGHHEKFMSMSPEKRSGVMKSSGAYEKAPEKLADRFANRPKEHFHDFMSSAVSHELSKGSAKSGGPEYDAMYFAADWTPTPAQIKAGNYAKGHRKFQGLDVTIENPAGSTRTGTDHDGKPWAVTMCNDYGYIRRSIGADGEQLDCYIGPNENATLAYVVHQNHPGSGTYDEDKTMLGFMTEADAKAAYLCHYNNPEFFGGITPVPMDQFKRMCDARANGPVKWKHKIRMDEIAFEAIVVAAFGTDDGHWVTIGGKHVRIGGESSAVKQEGSENKTSLHDAFVSKQKASGDGNHQTIEALGKKNILPMDKKLNDGSFHPVTELNSGSPEHQKWMNHHIQELHKSGHLQKAWDRQGNTHFGKTGAKLPAHLTQSDSSEFSSLLYLNFESDQPSDGHFVTVNGGTPESHVVFIGKNSGFVPKSLQAGHGESKRFSGSAIENRLVDHHEEHGGGVTAHDEATLHSHTSGHPFMFHKTLPAEVREYQAGRPHLRKLFKVTDNAGEAGGADTLHAMGNQKYFDEAERYAGGKLSKAKQFAETSPDPEIQFLNAIHNNLPAKSERSKTIPIKAGELRVGSQFKIHGHKFIVAEDDGGHRVLKAGVDYPETPVDALSTIPIDEGSFRGKRQVKEAIPFSAAMLIPADLWATEASFSAMLELM